MVLTMASRSTGLWPRGSHNGLRLWSFPTRDRGPEPDGRGATEFTRPAHSDDPGERPPGLAESGGRWETFARRDGDVPLQNPDGSQAARPPARHAEDRSPDCLFGDEPNDTTREAG